VRQQYTASSKIADDGESRSSQPHRKPVNDSKGSPCKSSEITIFCAASPAPGIGQEGRDATQHRAARAGQEKKAHEDAENMAMRRAKHLLDRQSSDLGGGQTFRRSTPPLGKQSARLRHVTRAKRQLNARIMATELAKAHRHIENSDVP
jgi:hypothetical protein